MLSRIALLVLGATIHSAIVRLNLRVELVAVPRVAHFVLGRVLAGALSGLVHDALRFTDQ